MRYAIILGVLLIATPLLVRLSWPEPFADAASYEGLRRSGLSGYDALHARPYHATMSDLLFRTFPPQLVLTVLAAVTLFCLSLYYDDELFILLVATSPVFITTFTMVSEAALAVSVIGLGSVLIRKRQYWAVLLVPVCFSLSFPLGILSAITFITVGLISGLPFVALGASFFALLSGAVFALRDPVFSLGLRTPSFADFIGIFSEASTLTVFLVFLGLVGFIVQWSSERKHEQLASLLIVPCALFFQHGDIILATFLAFYGSKAWAYLREREWHFEELRSMTLLLIIAGLLFSTLLVERERLTLDTDRVELVRFVTAAYPPGQGIAANLSAAPVLEYHGYRSGMPSLPPEPALAASVLRTQGYGLVVTGPADPLFADYPPAYAQGRYALIELS